MERHLDEVHLMKEVFNSEKGAKALDIIKDISMYDTQQYNPSMPVENTFFRCGMRQVYLEIINRVNADAQRFENIIKEMEEIGDIEL